MRRVFRRNKALVRWTGSVGSANCLPAWRTYSLCWGRSFSAASTLTAKQQYFRWMEAEEGTKLTQLMKGGLRGWLGGRGTRLICTMYSNRRTDRRSHLRMRVGLAGPLCKMIRRGSEGLGVCLLLLIHGGACVPTCFRLDNLILSGMLDEEKNPSWNVFANSDIDSNENKRTYVWARKSSSNNENKKYFSRKSIFREIFILTHGKESQSHFIIKTINQSRKLIWSHNFNINWILLVSLFQHRLMLIFCFVGCF